MNAWNTMNTMNTLRALALGVLTALALPACSDSGNNTDASSSDASSSDALATGTECLTNAQCGAADRCFCPSADGSEPCTCQPGTRGTGQNGVDRCTDGNDCASSLCVEGPEGQFYCSDVCESDTQCTGMLPRCSPIGVCARATPAS